MYERFIEQLLKMTTTQDKILAAVSGGVDSMTLLHLLHRTDRNFGVAHCNFSLRGDESDGDTALVVSECERMGVKLHKIQFDTHREMELRGECMQICARELRYDWFSDLCRDYGYTKIAIAHNSGDTIETFFINLLRGTGIKGMSGISETRDNIIRPLMIFSRNEIEQYAIENGVKWREDSSNKGTKYLRNKIRHLIIPELKKINTNFEQTMLSNLARVGSANDFIDNIISEITAKCVSRYRGQTTVAINVISKYKPFEFTLYQVLSPFGFNAEMCNDIAKCYTQNENSKHFKTTKYNAVLSRGLLILSENKDGNISDIIATIDDVESSFETDDFTLDFDVIESDMICEFPKNQSIAILDAEKVKLPMTLRYWRDGDAFIPLGMNGKKKLSDFFIDTKVNILDKEQQPLLCSSNGDIMWVVGRRIDDRYKVTDKTKAVLKITALYNK